MTGAAFDHMLQLRDQALLETVMRNVVVFSRMKSHQKAQVMDLLSSRGIHQVVEGQRHHLPVSHQPPLLHDKLCLLHAWVDVHTCPKTKLA